MFSYDPSTMLQEKDDIRDRLRDTRLLWDNGRKNGAFIMALVALAGVSRKRYPKHTSQEVYFDKLRKYHPNQKSQITAKEEKEKSDRAGRVEKSKNKRAQEFGDGKAFKCMVLDLLTDIVLPNPKPGTHPPKINFSLPLSKHKTTNIEDLFYRILRCTAIHQGTFASVAYLTERIPEGDVLRLTEPVGIPEWWIIHLIAALASTPELAVSVEPADAVIGGAMRKEIGKAIGREIGKSVGTEIDKEIGKEADEAEEEEQ